LVVICLLLTLWKALTLRYQAEHGVSGDELKTRREQIEMAATQTAERICTLASVAEQVPRWIAVLAEVAHGSTGAAGPGQNSPARLSGWLPLGMQVFTARHVADSPAQIRLAAMARQAFLRQGWLSPVFEERLRDALAGWALTHPGKRDALDELWSEASGDGRLDALLAGLPTEGNRATVRDTFRGGLQRWVVGEGAAAWKDAVGNQVELTAGTPDNSPIDELLAAPDVLDGYDFSANGATDGFHQKELTSSVQDASSEGETTGQAVSRVVLSRPVLLSALRYFSQDDSGSDWQDFEPVPRG